MRPLLVLAVVFAAIAVAVPSAGAARRNYAVFKVSVSGTETSQATGAEECQDEAGSVPPATASASFQFSTPKPRKLELARFNRGAIVVTNPGRGDISNTKLTGTGMLTRQSQFVPNGTLPPVCAGGQTSPGCGAKNISKFTILVQGGIRELTIQGSAPRPNPGLCLVPAPFAPVDLVGPFDTGVGGTRVHYRATVPSSMLNPRKKVIVIHGSGTATTGKDQEGAIHLTSASSTIKFTMRLVRVPLR
jgi:hypothetical protein